MTAPPGDAVGVFVELAAVLRIVRAITRLTWITASYGWSPWWRRSSLQRRVTWLFRAIVGTSP